MSYDREGPLLPPEEPLVCDRVKRRVSVKRRIDNLKESLRLNKELEAALKKNLLEAEKEFEIL